MARASVSFRFLVALSVLCSAAAYAATEKILHSFNGTLVHGSTPESALVRDASGNLYGTTFYGGAYSQGTVFKLTPASNGGWTQTVLYSFKGGSDGSSPAASLVIDTLGNLYGTTAYGGTASCGGYYLGCGTVFKLSPSSGAGWTESLLYTFQGGSDGSQPEAALVFDSAGSLYGTTVSGGRTPYSYGTVFKLSPSSGGSWTESILHSFTGLSDGSMPAAPLIFDASGNLYGTTEYGGTVGGVVFELTPNAQGTWSESVLYNFAGGTDGSAPKAPLIFDSAGNLYGTTYRGGEFSGGGGTVFELKPNGNGTWSENVLHSFGATSTDGLYPTGGVILDPAGNLYGMTFVGGNTGCYSRTGCGIVFQLAPSSGGQWTEAILHTFSGGNDGGNPYAGLIRDQAGNLYGTTAYGGSANIGAVFSLSQATGGGWTENTIYWLPGNDGDGPAGNLIADSAGNYYGTVSGGLYLNGAIFKLSPKSGGGWATSLIYSFKGVPDGAGPVNSLVFDTKGNLYGTTAGGGTTAGVCSNWGGCGTVFKLALSTGGKWTESVLHSFTGGADGIFPYTGLTFSGGNLFGGTFSGGGNGTGCSYFGCGVIFEMSPTSGGKWKESVAYTFTGGKDGGEPWYGSLISDASGNLYGTTTYTGCDGCSGYYPTVFEFSPNGTGRGTLNTLVAFADYGLPSGTLALDNAGNIYGTTYNDVYGPTSWGSVFELTQSGGTWSRSTLYSFSGGSDGKFPDAGVTFDAAGNLYGTTQEGGNTTCSSYGCGVLFKVTPESGGSWSFSAVHAFSGYPRDGNLPYAGVVMDSAGNLYGTTAGGGAYNYGAVYEVTP